MTLNHNIAEFLAEEDGGVLVFWGVSLAVILGLVAMSFDLGRISITQTEMQSFTDNVALAAAGELDRSDDAITRATNAASSLIQDRQTYGLGDKTLSGAGDFTLTFYSDLPADDTAVMTATTTDPAEARYVRVTANQTEVPLVFAAAFTALSGNNGPDNQVRAQSTAGMNQFACDVAPLMFCKPPNWTASEQVGTMVNLRSGGNGAAWAPGDFGFLDPSRTLVDTAGPCAGKSGGNLDACLIGAIGNITQCYSLNSVDIEPGQKNGRSNSIFNVRFDMYNTIMKSERTDADYAPAPNVIKGIVKSGGGGGPQCLGTNADISPDTVGLPRDSCFSSGGCGRFGDGDWTAGFNTYITTNYGGSNPFGIDPTADTRYDLYKAEIANPQGTNGILPNGLSETGRPQCSSQTPAGPERRLVIAAAIDCAANSINGAATNVPVAEFVEFFMTEPVAADGNTPPTLDIWGEVTGRADRGTGSGSTGFFRDVVQLHR